MKELYRKLSQYLHPASLLVAAAFDLLWGVPEGALTASWVGVVLLPVAFVSIFFVCFGAVTAIQRFGSGDEWSGALTKGLILGVLAAIPYSFIGMGVSAFWLIMRLTYGVDPEVILLGKLTRSWREIEGILRKLAPPDTRSQSLDEVINCLHSQRLLSRTLAEELHTLRKQRNITMHEMSTAELDTLVEQVQAMENTLRRRFLNG
jgi:hypothetical protein